MSTKIFNPKTGKWEEHGSSNALNIKILDAEGNFKSKNVEGALRELAENAGSASEDDINIINDRLSNDEITLLNHEERIAHIELNGVGGGGAAAPTITSTFAETSSVDEGTIVKIPIFFKSPNLGDGIAYITINGIESATAKVKQGNNTIEIGVLQNLTNTIDIYVKDRAEMMSNQLEFKIINGGIRLSTDFDSTADYSITDNIIMPYTIVTESKDDIFLKLTIDYDDYTIEAKNGYNEYDFSGKLSVGIHKIYMHAETGTYKSAIQKFNIVVVNSGSLYVSTTFEENQLIEYGTPINIDYRVSKMSTEEFTVNLYINNVLSKTLKQVSGSYYWTINDLEVDKYTVKIEALSSYGETSFVELKFKIIAGEYTPLKINQAGLIYWLNASGKTNNDLDRENPEDKSGNAVKTTLYNCNYSTNGWVNESLILDGNSYATIDIFPWGTNAINGSTIEIYYKANNIGIDDGRIFDYTDIYTPYKGCYIDMRDCKLASLANNRTCLLEEDEWQTVSFVIDRTTNKAFGKIYINGVCCGPIKLSDAGAGTSAVREDFSHEQKIYLNCKKGISNFGACEIKQIRIYSRALSHDEILKNYLAQITNLDEQKKAYDFCYNNTTTPVIKMTGDTTNMTLETPVQMRVKYTSPNTEIYGQSFDLPYCMVNWQGTSSLQYILKNYEVTLRDENMADYYYTPYKNTRPEKIFCLKADYMESSHANNVGLAKLINDCIYDTKNPSQLVDSNVRNTVCGFPILLYINDELQGVYNFNYDRYSTNAFGYDLAGGALSYEISANTDTTAGAFFKWNKDSGKTEIDYYKSDFEAIYPVNRRQGDDNFEEIKRLVEWVNDADDILFKEQIEEYFNLEYLLRYYLVVMMFGAVDNLGKNAKITTWDGRIWYFQFYDLDTTLGLDNTGLAQ